MMHPLHIASVTKSYDDRRVLEEVSFDLQAGEIFGLIGLNGAGKTTLIKIILDLTKADRGHIDIFGKPTMLPAARAVLSYLPEKFQPSRYLRGMEYLDLSLAHYGKKLVPEAARAQAAMLDLNPKVLEARVSSYSKGMGQKLGLLGAFMVNAPLLMLDEPMSGLDPSARIKLKDMLVAAKQQGKTIFFSSHILSDIEEICDRIGVIHEGKLFFVGTPDAFKQQYGGPGLERAFLRSIQAI